jgi:predicted alpha/beta superfamily hydrolase
MKLDLKDRSELVSCGKLYTFDIIMTPIPDGRTRTIRVWLPDSYDGGKRFPVLYMHDGQYTFPETDLIAGMGSWRFDQIVNSLEPELQCVVVAIDTSDDRGSELLPPYKRNPAHRIPRNPGTPDYIALGHYYADFVRDTLKPLIDENFMTLSDAAHTGVGGASMGGLQSFYMTMRDPDVFGRSLDLSPGLDILDVSCLELIDSCDPERLKNARFYLYSGDQGLDVTIMYSMLTVYRRLKDMLKLTNRQIAAIVDSRESHWGTSWSKYLADGIRFLFSADNSVESPPVFSQNLSRDAEHSS